MDIIFFGETNADLHFNFFRLLIGLLIFGALTTFYFTNNRDILTQLPLGLFLLMFNFPL
jgi:hypothetical protein